MAAIYERVESRKLSISLESPTADFEYVIFQTFDEEVVRGLVESTIGPYYLSSAGGVLPFQNYEITHQGNGVWFATARYSARQQRGAAPQSDLSGTGGGTGEPPGGGSPLQPAAGTSGGRTASFNFELGTQSFKMTQSLSTVAGYRSGIGAIPDFKGAIGVNGEEVEGVEIDRPVLTFSETHYFPAEFVNEAYVVTLRDIAARPINLASFRGFAPGEVRFLGATGSLKDEQSWEVTFRFAVSPNETDITVGDITGIEKKGWEYMWINYEPQVDGAAHKLILAPVVVKIEKTYFNSSFDGLGIGA